MENEKRLEDALSDVKAELSELKMALNEITDRYDTYWNLNMTEAIKFYRGDTGNKVFICIRLYSFYHHFLQMSI